MFPCVQCGICCNKIDVAVHSVKVIIPDYIFPYTWGSNGKCEKLIDNMCSVYDNRPLICNIDSMHVFFDIPKDEYYDLNIQSCNQLISEKHALDSNS